MPQPITITHPTAEPLSIEELRSQVRVVAFGEPLAHPDDAFLLAAARDAREACEQFLQRSLAPKVLELALDAFPSGADGVMLPMGPVTSVEAVTYLDDDGLENSIGADAVALDLHSDPPWLLPSAGAGLWPRTGAIVNGIRIRYRAGYSLPDDEEQVARLPGPLRRAMLLTVGSFYRDREDSSEVRLHPIPTSARSLMQPFRLGLGV